MNVKVGNKRLIACAIVTAMPAVSFAQTCSVNEASFLWEDNTAQEVDLTSGPIFVPPTANVAEPNTYSEAFATGVVTWLNTDLDSGSGDISIVSGDWGPNGLLGATLANSGTTPCVIFDENDVDDSNLCNTTTLRADEGFIYINDYYFKWPNRWSSGQSVRLIQHEIGHVFGMAHQVWCSSFMYGSPQGWHPDFLQWWEVNWINNKY